MESDPQQKPARTLGVVTGLASEAVVVNALLGGDPDNVAIACAGADAERAARQARRLVDGGAKALMSFGIAGALSPELTCGDLVIAVSVHGTGGGVLSCDPAWHGRLCTALDNAMEPASGLEDDGDLPHKARLPYRVGALLASPDPLMAAAGKAKAWHDTGCLAVDMESGAVAAVAAEAGLPFLAVRAVADTAADSLPSLVKNAVDPDGLPSIRRAVLSLLLRPWQLPGVLRLARQSEVALGRLKRLGSVKEALFGGF